MCKGAVSVPVRRGHPDPGGVGRAWIREVLMVAASRIGFITLKNCFLVSIIAYKSSAIGLIIMMYNQCAFLCVSS